MFDAAIDPTTGAMPDPQQMLADLAGSDPRMAMMLRLLQSQSGAHIETAPPPEEELENERDALIAEFAQRLDEAEARAARIEKIARRLNSERRMLGQRVADLAAALGACGLCWGEDSACPCCRGRGRPGMVRPDPELRLRLFGRARPAPPMMRADSPLLRPVPPGPVPPGIDLSSQGEV
jgi:hypothetical protein